MFGDDKTQAPRDDSSQKAKPSESHSTTRGERTRSKPGYDFTDWASI